MPTFDGDNLIITLDAPVDGALTVDVQQDIYKPWKQWLLDSHGRMKYPPAFFDSFGGNNMTPGLQAGAYFVFQNSRGWRIRSSEENQTIYIVGNLIPSDSSLPIVIPTIGAYSVLYDGLQPITQNIDDIKTTIEGVDVNVRWLKKIINSEKEVIKIATSWYLIIYDTGETSGGVEILRKKLTDPDGSDISDLAAGTLAAELENSV